MWRVSVARTWLSSSPALLGPETTLCPCTKITIRESQRLFSKKSRTTSAARPPPPTRTVDPRIQARPPGEKPVETKFPLPDVGKEKELGILQSEVADLYRSSEYRNALKLSHELLQATTAHFGKDHPATASAHNNLGLLNKHLGEFDDSRREYRKALAIYKRVVGTDHASYASALHNLGTCARTQLHLDASLRATDRMSLLQESAQVLEEAYTIRLAELGREHPHTVASLSSWGATLASQILSHYKKSQDKWVSTIPDQLSKAGWQAAEEHLESALNTAIESPRGRNVSEDKSRNQRSKGRGNRDSLPKSPDATKGMATLSAAAAAQNLAVFLKARAVTETPPNAIAMNRAKELYEQALAIRTKLLPANHFDVYTTQYSLAELLEAWGDTDRANAIRQEILESYEPADAPNSEASSGDENTT